MKRAHRVALKPTPDQESLFSQHAGYARFAYNWAVGEIQGWPGRWRVAARQVAQAALESGEADDCAVGCGAVPKRRQVCHHRLRAGSG